MCGLLAGFYKRYIDMVLGFGAFWFKDEGFFCLGGINVSVLHGRRTYLLESYPLSGLPIGTGLSSHTHTCL